jgi:hypothetical protein
VLLREEHELQVFENKGVKIFGAVTDGVTNGRHCIRKYIMILLRIVHFLSPFKQTSTFQVLVFL